jgi:hypothetical protein
VKFCPHCGFYLEWTEPEDAGEVVAAMTRKPGDDVVADPQPIEPPPQIEDLDAQQLVICPHCGTQNPTDRTLCTHCGNPLAGAAPPPPPPPPLPPRERPEWVVPAAIAAGVVLAAFVVIWALTRGGGDAAGPDTSATPSTPAEGTSVAPPDGVPAEYLAAIADYLARADGLATRVQAANDTWDDREDEVEGDVRANLFTRTEAELQDVRSAVQSLVAEAGDLERPAAVAQPNHRAIRNALDAMLGAADGMLDGLSQPRGEKELRLQSRDDFVAAVEDLRSAVSALA